MDVIRLLDDARGKPGDPGLVDEVLRGAGLTPRKPRIRCPLCAWRPRRHDRWCCRPSCGHVWNTFETAARCPACGYQWTWTACLACHRRSPHVDWYERSGDGGAST